MNTKQLGSGDGVARGHRVSAPRRLWRRRVVSVAFALLVASALVPAVDDEGREPPYTPGRWAG